MSPGPGGSGVAGATWALIAAAGAGERLGIDRPKAFATLGGRPLLAESIDRLDGCPWIDATSSSQLWNRSAGSFMSIRLMTSKIRRSSAVMSCGTGTGSVMCL